jgi:putative transcriptional regulator
VIEINLREMMDAYQARTGLRITYSALAETTGLSRAALESMASRKGYNASLAAIERICLALHCTPGDLLTLTADESGARK